MIVPVAEEIVTGTSGEDPAGQGPDTGAADRIEVSRVIEASPAEIFRVLCDPAGHVAIDSSGMLQSAEGEPVSAPGDSFVVHMDRESLGDRPMGRYDVTVTIRDLEPGRAISWTILGTIRPPIGHVYGYRLEPVEGGTRVTSYCDWSEIDPRYREMGLFPLLSDAALKATLGILARTVQHS
ncbi:SRPBCC family protein [Pseudonocardia phyllosphaerae]|uniref:SRPBCC family protein n=1 Tax=Pseudonocardia phyllosphaerae TaxID=3390502 RepID=UPI003978794E